jgi:hypothetical protein
LELNVRDVVDSTLVTQTQIKVPSARYKFRGWPDGAQTRTSRLKRPPLCLSSSGPKTQLLGVRGLVPALLEWLVADAAP